MAVKTAKKNNSSKKQTPVKHKTSKTIGKAAEKQHAPLPGHIRAEIWGVVWIALGLLLSLSVYFIESGILVDLVAKFIFGIVGVIGYVLPIALIAGGILTIAKGGSGVGKSTALFMFLIVLCVTTLVNTNLFLVEGKTFFGYCTDIYAQNSVTHSGGGVAGALLAYPFILLLGKTGTNIILIACILIILLVATRISIAASGAAVKKRVEEVRERVLPQTERGKNKRDSKKPTGMYVGGLSDVQAENDGEDFLDFLPLTGKIPRADMDKSTNNTDEPGGEEDELVPFEADLDEINNSVSVEAVDSGLIFDLPEHERRSKHFVEPPDFSPLMSNKNENEEEVSILPYQRPPYTLLKFPNTTSAARNESPDEKAKTLLATLASFKIAARITNISVGPVITRFELQPAQGVRVSSITNLSNDIALALAAEKVRIEAPIPGKAAIGIEIPNKSVHYVYLREIIESPEFRNARSSLTFALGKDIAGKTVTADLAKMPHLLIAGTTGSGKSVCLNSIILSLIFKSSPEDLRLILIDPKVVEFRVYSNLPHLLVPVVTDKRKAASALRWAVSEMDRRYKELASRGVRDITRYNLLQTDSEEKLPKMVIIIDELAELMMAAAKEVEESICRIAQLGRACGIHLIVATQRPSADIITGLIKSNISTRIAFAVSEPINSRIILDCNGAEKLMGSGDMLYNPTGTAKPVRIQCAFVSDDEVEAVTGFFDRTQAQPQFDDTADSQIEAGVGASAGMDNSSDEDLFTEAVRVVINHKQASASLLQRRLRIGYNKASRLIEEMEQRGIVSGFDGSKPRKVLIEDY